MAVGSNKDQYFFHTQLWFPASDHDFRWFERDFQCFCKIITGKKHCGRNRIDHGHLCGMEFTSRKFVFHKNHSLSHMISGIQTHSDELCFALVPMMSSMSHRAWGGHLKNTYELLNLRALKCSPVNKIYIFQCMGKIFCVEFQREPLKFHTKYLIHTLKRYDFHTLKF